MKIRVFMISILVLLLSACACPVSSKVAVPEVRGPNEISEDGYQNGAKSDTARADTNKAEGSSDLEYRRSSSAVELQSMDAFDKQFHELGISYFRPVLPEGVAVERVMAARMTTTGEKSDYLDGDVVSVQLKDALYGEVLLNSGGAYADLYEPSPRKKIISHDGTDYYVSESRPEPGDTVSRGMTYVEWVVGDYVFTASFFGRFEEEMLTRCRFERVSSEGE